MTLNFSPSIIPHITATIGIKYVTEDAKIGDERCTILLNNTFAIPVPTIDNIVIYPNAFVV